MPSYSNRSLSKLKGCHDDLITLFEEVIESYDNSILEGPRTTKRQQELFAQGKSKLNGITKISKHQITECRDKSMAVDSAPWPIDWNDLNRFYHYVGYVKGVADRLYHEGKMTHKIRCGADWDGDNCFKDQSFHDLPHFELIENK
jgi:peptidoglycan L-alanyl-D-glutamate endopeptidase CwlK